MQDHRFDLESNALRLLVSLYKTLGKSTVHNVAESLKRLSDENLLRMIEMIRTVKDFLEDS